LIAPRKSAFWEWGMACYVRRLAKRRFHRLYIAGAEHVQSAQGSVLLVANHVSWWDGLVLLLANRLHFERVAYAAMSEEGLRRYPVFRRLGAYSLPHGTAAADLLGSIRFSHRVLQTPNALLVFFAQGEQRHESKRPLGFADGIGLILRTCKPSLPVTVIPAALHYTFLEHAKPEVFLTLGPGIVRDEVLVQSAGGLTLPTSPRALNRQYDHALAGTLEARVTDLVDAQIHRVARFDTEQRLAPPGYTSLLRRSYGRQHAAAPVSRLSPDAHNEAHQTTPRKRPR